jgi:hypothetical protein
MKIILTKPVDHEISYIRIIVPVHGEDVPPDLPFMQVGGVWDVIVNLATGEIQGLRHAPWPKGQDLSFDLYWKIVDRGTYRLLGPDYTVVCSIEQDYVPNGVIPGEWGDYIDLKINQDGFITNWNRTGFDFSAFTAQND